MVSLGLPIPSGFTITTETCDIYYKNKAILFLIKLGFILYYIDFFIKLWYIPIIKGNDVFWDF